MPHNYYDARSFYVGIVPTLKIANTSTDVVYPQDPQGEISIKKPTRRSANQLKSTIVESTLKAIWPHMHRILRRSLGSDMHWQQRCAQINPVIEFLQDWLNQQITVTNEGSKKAPDYQVHINLRELAKSPLFDPRLITFTNRPIHRSFSELQLAKKLADFVKADDGLCYRVGEVDGVPTLDLGDKYRLFDAGEYALDFERIERIHARALAVRSQTYIPAGTKLFLWQIPYNLYHQISSLVELRGGVWVRPYFSGMVQNDGHTFDSRLYSANRNQQVTLDHDIEKAVLVKSPGGTSRKLSMMRPFYNDNIGKVTRVVTKDGRVAYRPGLILPGGTQAASKEAFNAALRELATERNAEVWLKSDTKPRRKLG